MEKGTVSFRSMREWVEEKCGGYAVIDGGLATELERHGADLKDPLWSAKCLLNSSHLVKQVCSLYHYSIYSCFCFCETWLRFYINQLLWDLIHGNKAIS